MAKMTFLGGTNLTTGANWTGGVAPGTGDTAIIPILGSPTTVTAGLDYTLKDLASFITQPGCNVQVGESGNPLRMACGKVSHSGDKTLYLKAEHATLDIDEVEVNSNNQTLAIDIDDDGTAQALFTRAIKGYVNYNSNITSIPYLEIGYRSLPDSDAIVNIAAHATNIATIIAQSAGILTCSREITNMIAGGGRTIINGTEPVTNLYGVGGSVDYNTTGTLTLGMILSGLLDFTKDWNTKIVTQLRGLSTARILTHDGIDIQTDETQSGTIVSGAVSVS